MQIQPTLKLDLPQFSPLYEKTPIEETFINQKIASVAKRAFFHFTAALALNLAVMTFIATPFSVAILTGALIISLGDLIGQAAIDFCFSDRSFKGSGEIMQQMESISQASIINTMGLSGPNILIHEAGHAVCTVALLNEARPALQIFPFLGGVTHYTTSNGLSKLGSLIGEHRSMLCISAAGFVASTLFAMLEFGLAEYLHESYPRLSEVMTIHGVLQIAQEILYAFTAFMTNKGELAHDFVNLWVSGRIHPLIPIAMMILLPVIEIALLRLLASRDRSQKIHQMVMDQTRLGEIAV